MPDNVSAAAFAMAIKAGGACKSGEDHPADQRAEGVAVHEEGGSGQLQAGREEVGWFRKERARGRS